jgi:hypothetical protein
MRSFDEYFKWGDSSYEMKVKKYEKKYENEKLLFFSLFKNMSIFFILRKDDI